MIDDKTIASAPDEEMNLEIPDKIRISLINGTQDESLSVPTEAIAVPSTIRRKGLSAVVNHLLGRVEEDEEEEDDDKDEEDLSSKQLKFDFMIENKLLRTGVEAFARREGMSLEEAIEIRYFPAMQAPDPSGNSEELPDWISAMSFSQAESASGGYLSTGGYDGAIRVFSSLECREVVSAAAHAGPIKCISSAPFGANRTVVATGSIDQTLLTHGLTQNADGEETLSLQAVYSGGHFNSIESVNISKNGSGDLIMASGDWDGGICLWKIPDLNDTDDDATDSNKKRKTESTKVPSQINAKEVQPTASWKAHASNISGILWGENNTNNTIITGSWDHSIKVFDVERQDCLLTLNGSRVVSAMGRCSNSDIVATGHPDCTVRLWDMRTNKKEGVSTIVSDNTLKPSHKAWISALQWSPTEPHSLATNSYDGTVKMWDIRSSLPLHTIKAHAKGEKGLCLAYGQKMLFSGGSDCVVKKFGC